MKFIQNRLLKNMLWEVLNYIPNCTDMLYNIYDANVTANVCGDFNVKSL
jgi:hypothetical protein